MPYLRSGATSLYYEVSGSGVPILGIHGTPSSALLWEDAAVELARHGRVVIYDRRGFHRSGPAPASLHLDDHVEDASALLREVGGEPGVVIGRSTGGQIALALAQRHPEQVRGLVLLEPALFTIARGPAAWAADLRAGILAAVAGGTSGAAEASIRPALGEETWAGFPTELREHFASLDGAVLAELRGTGLDLSAEPLTLSAEQLVGLAPPVLVVAAADSPEPLSETAHGVSRAIPHAELLEVSGGHLINPADPVVLGFVDRVTAV